MGVGIIIDEHFREAGRFHRVLHRTLEAPAARDRRAGVLSWVADSTAPTGSADGELSGSYPASQVAQVRGTAAPLLVDNATKADRCRHERRGKIQQGVVYASNRAVGVVALAYHGVSG